MRLGSLCSGYGGLDLAVEQVFGASTAWQAETDPHCARILEQRFPGVPNIGDLTATDFPLCDILAAGFPCQPVSLAGRRGGTEDERWLWDDIAAAVGRMDTRPRWIVLENVRGLLSANGGDAMARVVHGLARLGYVGSWRVVRAADAGAPHRRERVFIVARHSDDFGCERAEPEPRRDTGRAHAAPADADERRAGWDGGALPRTASGARRQDDDVRTAGDAGPDAPADACRCGCGRLAVICEGHGIENRQDGGRPQGDDEPARDHQEPSWGTYEPAIRRWEHLTRPAPAPTDDRGRLSARFVEWMQGLPAGWVTDVDIPRTGQRRALGNGVVPQQAVLALRLLLGLDTHTHTRPSLRAADTESERQQRQRPTRDGRRRLEDVYLPTPTASDRKGPNMSGSGSASSRSMATLAAHLGGKGEAARGPYDHKGGAVNRRELAQAALEATRGQQ